MVALYFGAQKHPFGQSLEKGVPDSHGSGLVSTPCFVNLCLHVGWVPRPENKHPAEHDVRRHKQPDRGSAPRGWTPLCLCKKEHNGTSCLTPQGRCQSMSGFIPWNISSQWSWWIYTSEWAGQATVPALPKECPVLVNVRMFFVCGMKWLWEVAGAP